jgi:hypothetical protein
MEQRIDYQTYERQLQETYVNNPIDISVGFFGLCSYQHIAWDYVFQCIRKYYPTAPIVLINDGFDQYDYSEMAAKHNCIHLKKDREICLHYPDITSSHEFLNRTKEVADLLGTDWIIHLHPDVICQGRICYLPPSELSGVSAGSFSGLSGNNWNTPDWQPLVSYIRKHQPDIELNGFGWCGGSIMNRSAFYKVYESLYGTDAKFTLEEIRENTNKCATEHEDTMMSVLFALNGYPYRIWKDNPEYHRGSKEGAFLHGYKEHYDFKKQGLSDAEYFARCRYQNITKRKDIGLLENQNYNDVNQQNI